MVGVEECAIHCPYCGEGISVLIDTSIVQQEYTEDCQVCCQPMLINVLVDAHEGISISSVQENA